MRGVVNHDLVNGQLFNCCQMKQSSIMKAEMLFAIPSTQAMLHQNFLTSLVSKLHPLAWKCQYQCGELMYLIFDWCGFSHLSTIPLYIYIHVYHLSNDVGRQKQHW